MLTPFIHWPPISWHRPIVPRCNLWSLLVRVTPDRRQFCIQHYLSDVRLLSFGEVRALFPGARVIRECFCEIAKSLVAMKAP
ncbi:Methyltransferase type 11 (fragment) [Candidatus Sulfopaludibacter sp. SbA4]